MPFRSVYVPHAHACSTTKTLFLFLFLQNFKRWRGRVIWSNFFTTFFCLGGRSWVQGPESSPTFSNRICPKHNMTSRQDNTMHKRQDDMTSRQDDMTNSITESPPIETFASNANLSVYQMSPIIYRWKLVKHLHYLGENRRTKSIKRSSYVLLKCVAWLNQLQHFS